MNQRYDEDWPAEDEMETVHIYVYEEKSKQPLRVTLDHLLYRLMQVVAIGMFMGFCLLPGSPVYALKVLRVPTHFLPIQVFRVEASIVPTGTLTHPATQSHGTLTVYNGLSVMQQLPAGVIVLTGNGSEVATDQGVTIPAAHLPSVGVATVPAHAVQAGSQGNIQAGAIDQDYGSSLTIKNLSAFQGGQDAYTEQIITSADRQKALAEAREQLTRRRPKGLLARPCTEQTTQAGTTLTVAWSCQYVTYTAPRGVQVLAARVEGKEVLLQVRAIVLPS